MKRIMSKEEFLSVYERQQASGLTIKDFCENETYSSSCFHYWKKKFGLSRTYTGFRHALYALGPDMESCLFFSPFFRTEPSGTDLL